MGYFTVLVLTDLVQQCKLQPLETQNYLPPSAVLVGDISSPV